MCSEGLSAVVPHFVGRLGEARRRDMDENDLGAQIVIPQLENCMRKTALTLALLMPCVNGHFLAAAQNRPQRLHIGLVLAGEGPASTVNIGVLKALERLQVPTDVIVGTNMGAVIGGSYASGTSVAELEAIFEGTDWKDFLADTPVAHYLSRPCREASAARLRCRSGAGGSSLLSTPDLISGRNLDLLLQALLVGSSAQQTKDFSQLPIPFRSVATDVVTFEPVVMTSGNLAAALRPSLVALDPVAVVHSGGRVIGDVPGFTRSIAIDAARQAGADVVVVVDVEQELSEKERGPDTDRETLLRSVLAGLGRTESLKAARQADFLIQPETRGIANGTDGRNPRTTDYVAAGLAATLNSPPLKRLALSDQDYRDWRRAIRFRR